MWVPSGTMRAERYEVDFDLRRIVLTSTLTGVPLYTWTFDDLSPDVLVCEEYLAEFLEWLPEL